MEELALLVQTLMEELVLEELLAGQPTKAVKSAKWCLERTSQLENSRRHPSSSGE